MPTVMMPVTSSSSRSIPITTPHTGERKVKLCMALAGYRRSRVVHMRYVKPTTITPW